MQPVQSVVGESSFPRALVLVGGLVLATTAGALVVYKAGAALATIARVESSGTLAPKEEWISTASLPAVLRPFAGAVNYFSWVLIALAFGVLLGAMVRTFVPRRWLAVTVGAPGVRGQLIGAIVGAPLMLCSCCVAPLFEGVYARTRRLGPSLGLMFASPALNPAALLLTFLLFPAELAWGRLVLSVLLVLGASSWIGAAFEARGSEATLCAVERDGRGWRSLGSFATSLREVAVRALPSIVIGVLISVALTGVFPVSTLSGGAAVLAVVLVAAVAVPLALPTFAEIPLGLALAHAGAPDGAVLALLLAGPAINLPSLLTLRKVSSARVAVATAGSVFALALLGGLSLMLLER